MTSVQRAFNQEFSNAQGSASEGDSLAWWALVRSSWCHYLITCKMDNDAAILSELKQCYS